MSKISPLRSRTSSVFLRGVSTGTVSGPRDVSVVDVPVSLTRLHYLREPTMSVGPDTYGIRDPRTTPLSPRRLRF